MEFVLLLLAIVYAVQRHRLAGMSLGPSVNALPDRFLEWKRLELRSRDIVMWVGFAFLFLEILLFLAGVRGLIALSWPVVILVLLFAGVVGSRADRIRTSMGLHFRGLYVGRWIVLSIASTLLTLVVIGYGWRWVTSGAAKRSPEMLLNVALSGGTPRDREVAAADLVALGATALPQMKRCLEQSKTPEVRALMMVGLAQHWDFDSVPAFLAGLDDESPLVRARAGDAVQKFMFVDVRYDAFDPTANRRAAILAYRKEWETLQDTPGFALFRERIKGAPLAH